MHAREWIGPSIVTYIVNELTQNRTANQDILDSVDIYITPIANPDGIFISLVYNLLKS